MSPKKVTEEEFWITNVKQKMDVMLSDLGFCARAGKSYNLLDSRHFHYTKEQLQKSAESGSLYKKRDRIAIRKVQPEPPILPPGAYVSDQPFL